jgi:hypothetical protein
MRLLINPAGRILAARPRLRAIVALLAASMASSALADRRELYTVLAYEPGFCRFDVPVGSGDPTTRFCNSVAAAAYYGFTNSVHLGGRVRASRMTDIHFTGTTVRLGDGSASYGDIYEDHWSLGIGALAAYRFDIRGPLAPVAELEAGVVAHKYDRIEHVPSGATHTVPEGSKSSTELYAAASLLAEYRFANRWAASAGMSGQLESGRLRPWSVTFPVRVAYIW